MKKCPRSLIVFCLLIEMLFLSLLSYAQTRPVTSDVKTEGGLHVVTFSLPQGTIKAYFPDDMTARDTVSGMVSVNPTGATDAEKAKNRDVLSGFVIDLGDGNNVKAGRPGFTWIPKIPQPSSSGKYLIGLIEIVGSDSKPVASATIPINAALPTVPVNFSFPKLGQTERRITITGPFDGNTSNTGVSIGGRQVPVMAESPRKIVLATPVDVTGPTEIWLKEKDTEKTAPFRNVRVDLSVKPILNRGENTALMVKVSGLQGIKGDIPLDLVATGTVTMQGGNNQSLQIQPAQVSSDGQYSQNFELTGVQAGGFNVTATVKTDLPTPQKGECEWVCQDTIPEIVLLKRNVQFGKTVYTFEVNFTPNCSGPDCNLIDTTSYKWTAAGTAAYSILPGTDKAKKLVVTVTKPGTFELTVEVILLCHDRTGCSSIGTKAFDVSSADYGPVQRGPSHTGTPTTNLSKCNCECEFVGSSAIDPVGVGKDNVYSFEPFVKTGCTGSSLDCKVKDIIYEWSVSPASTAGYSVYAVAMPNKDKRLRVKINKSGTLALSVKVTVTCGEGTTCTSTATKTFNVTAPEFWDVKRGPSGTPTTFNFPCGDRCDQTLPDIVHQKNDPLGGTIYSFEPKIDPICSSGLCAYQSLSYEWSFGPDSNAEYTLQAGTEKSKRLVVKITKGGTLELSVNVRVKCNNGTTCLVTGTRFFELIASVVIGPCTCACKFNTPAITFASGGGLYAFSPEVSTSCTGNYCQGQPSYSWSIGVGSTASYKIFADTDKTSLFGVTAMTAGKLEVVLTVAMKCEDGKTCSATTSKTFDVKP